MGKPAEWPSSASITTHVQSTRNGICGPSAIDDMTSEHGYRTDSR